MILRHRQSLGFWSTRISCAMKARLDERTQALGLSCPAAIALVAIDQFGPTTLVDLAQALENAHPSVLRQIDVLEDSGFVERLPHEHDRRMKIVSLTAKGRKVIPAIHSSIRDVQAEALRGLKKNEIEELMKQFHKIGDNLGMREFPDAAEPAESSPGRNIARAKSVRRK